MAKTTVICCRNRSLGAKSGIFRHVVIGYLALCLLALWFSWTPFRGYKDCTDMAGMQMSRVDASIKDRRVIPSIPSIPDVDGYQTIIAGYRNNFKETCDSCNCVEWKPVDGYKHTKVAIVITVQDALPYFQMCLRALQTNTNNYHLYLVDDFSGSETKAFLGLFANQDHVVLLNTTGDQPQGYTKVSMVK